MEELHDSGPYPDDVTQDADSARRFRELGLEAWRWSMAQVRRDDGRVWLPLNDEQAEPSADSDCVYDGIAGLVPALSELALTRAWTDEESALGQEIAERIADPELVTSTTEMSMYGGGAGHAVALRMLTDERSDAWLTRLRDLAGPDGWQTSFNDFTGVVTDVVMGNAGIGLAAEWCGGSTSRELLGLAADTLVATADTSDDGLDWAMCSAYEKRMPNFSHGTAGIASTLAIASVTLDRPELLELAVRGAEHVIGIGDTSNGGLRVPVLVPHGDSDSEPVAFTWCHGGTGTSYLFAALDHAGVASVAGRPPAEWRLRSLRGVETSGVPERLRPGFWDNDGRCCGTAGAGGAMLDAVQSTVDDAQQLLAFAVRLGDALAGRAVVDESGARWRFVEHRRTPSLLPPSATWMQGASGIAAYLLRLARVLDDGPTAAVVDLPDQWWAVPAAVRTVHA